MMTRSLNLITLFLAASLHPLLSVAQEPEMGNEPRKRIEELRRIKMIDALNLTEEQAIRMSAREKDFRLQEHELSQQRQKALAQLRESIKAGASDHEIEKLVNAIHSTSMEMSRKRFDYLMSLKDLLTTRQIGQLVVFEDTFVRELRKMLQDVGRRRGHQKREP